MKNSFSVSYYRLSTSVWSKARVYNLSLHHPRRWAKLFEAKNPRTLRTFKLFACGSKMVRREKNFNLVNVEEGYIFVG